MPIIILGSTPQGSGRFIAFVFLSAALVIALPVSIGCAAYGFGFPVTWPWPVLFTVPLVYSIIKISAKTTRILEWRIEQYSKPSYAVFDNPVPAKTILDKIAVYIAWGEYPYNQIKQITRGEWPSQ